ncbi:uncharacterized protein MONOS_18565 [Monocercomonoides exilis]|uniref:uncharacterized protein n=1 Tax=Monocercomonoides exilis TaxID=2049356 RepID=UPI00355A68BB|nr:hypothetical protein MONOS_18565 [Monocercomonoides exilis]
MSICEDDKCENGVQTMTRAEKFSKLFCELEHCTEDEQEQIIIEMNELIDTMNEDEYYSVSSTELFNKICKMIEERKMSIKNSVLLLKFMGYCKALKTLYDLHFEESSLRTNFEKMIIDESKKKKEKKEKLLVDLCECNLMLNEYVMSEELLSVCVQCLMKVASSREKREEEKKQVEMALLSLSYSGCWNNMAKDLHFDEIKEIIQYHQEHNNLTQLAYQSVWEFLMYGLEYDGSLEYIIVNKLHFVREAVREIDELSRCVDWMRKEKNENELKKVLIILMRWLRLVDYYFYECGLWNEASIDLLFSVMRVFRVSRENERAIRGICLKSFQSAMKNIDVEVEDLLKSGAVDAVLGEIIQSNVDSFLTDYSLSFLRELCVRLMSKIEKKQGKIHRTELKRMVFESMEEEGYEDCIIRLCQSKAGEIDNSYFLIKKLEDYFVNI